VASEPVDSELERLRNEVAALRATEAQYRSVIAAMTEGVVVQDEMARILECNAAAEEILGLTRDQMSGRTSLDPRWRAIHEDGSPFPGDTHPAYVTLRTRQPCHNVVMGVHKPDGRLTWISINSQPIAGTEPGTPRVVATFSDITEFTQALADLQTSEARLQVAMRAARMGTWQWEIGEDRVLWSDTVEDVFGIPRGTFGGTFQAYLELIHDDERAHVRSEIEAVMVPGGERDSFHVRHRVGQGLGERWLDCHGRIFRDVQGRLVRMAGVVIDVTDVHRLEQQVHRSQRLEAIGRFAGGIAHDFNNVLTIILSAVEMRARRGGDATAELEMVRNAALRAAQLTKQLLAFARRRASGVATVDLAALVESLRPLLARLVGERILLQIAVAPGRWLVRADAGQLEQVLINLVANARDAIRDTGSIQIAVEPAGDELLLTVQDDGAGMPPDVLERVFEPFFTTKSSGTGLGLATSYGIIQQHGGHIEATSTLGAGTRFEIRLPRHAAEPAEAAAHSQAEPELPRGDETLLLVEDDPMIRRVGEDLLREHGYRVLVAADGIEGFAVAKQHAGEVALVITDAVMPRMGGAELAAQLRASWPALPILVLSGYDPDERPGVATLPHLDKPYAPAELMQRVRELLDRART